MSNKRKVKPPVDIATLLAEDTRPEKVVPICLRGHLQAQWDELKAEFDALPDGDEQALMAERGRKRRLAEQMEELRQEMAAGTVHFRLRALPRRRTPGMAKDAVVWHELVEQHPPRKGKDGKPDPRDAPQGINVATFFDALVKASIVEPQLSDEQWQALDGKLTDGQFDQLAWAAWRLNRTGVDVPFSRAVSKTMSSDAGSRRRDGSASA